MAAWIIIFLPWLALLLMVFLDVIRIEEKWKRSDKISFAAVLLNILVLVVAGYAYSEAKRQADLSDDRSKIEHRGQIIDVVDSWHVNRIHDASGPVVSFSLFNPGRTPAYILKGTYEAFTGVDLPQRFAEEPRDLPRLPKILRQDQKSLIVISQLLPSVNAKAIEEGKLFYYLRIIILYRDIFNTQYEMRATAKYGKIIDANGNEIMGFEFPEAPLPKQLWKEKGFVDRRQYNSHRRLED